MKHYEKLKFLTEYLIRENPNICDTELPRDERELFRLFRGLVNIRPPMPADREFLRVQNEYLREEISLKGITDAAELTPFEDKIYLWQGDIVTLKCGGIVNAANSGLTGCWQPCHECVDNCIHTFAGVQLRLECADIMRRQGRPEPAGLSKITSAYNLPCEKIIHTVGPIVSGTLNGSHRSLLKDCYVSCLEAAAENALDSVAFCCISTGVFGFPNREAAEIAVKTVREFVKTKEIKVIFNVFKREDLWIYEQLLGGSKTSRSCS